VLDWLVAKAKGHELTLFDTLWRDNAALKGYPVPDVERHLQWQPQRGRQVMVELRQLQMDQRNLEHLTPARCAVDIPDYSTDWSQGGPIIERERLTIAAEGDPKKPVWVSSLTWPREVTYEVGTAVRFCSMRGPTSLIAAMRCYTASKLGDYVDVPEELCQQPKT
jgi:hypothetical protein